MYERESSKQIPTHKLQELGSEVATRGEFDNLGIDVYIELGAKWYIYASTHQIDVD